MSLDGQVLVIAFVAVALKLFLWSREDEAVVIVEPDRKELLRLDDSRLRFTTEARPDRAEGTFATSLSPRLKGDRYV